MCREKYQLMRSAVILLLALAWMLITGCRSVKPIYTVETVDLKRFMGDWYVIASIPT